MWVQMPDPSPISDRLPGRVWAGYGVIDRIGGGARILDVDDKAVVLLLGELDDDRVSAGPDIPEVLFVVAVERADDRDPGDVKSRCA